MHTYTLRIHTRAHPYTHTHTHEPSEYVEYLLLLLHFRVAFFPFCWFTLKPSSVCAVVPLFRLFVHHIHEIYSRSGYEFFSLGHLVIHWFTHTHILTHTATTTTNYYENIKPAVNSHSIYDFSNNSTNASRFFLG